jgi:hypothetical protein
LGNGRDRDLAALSRDRNVCHFNVFFILLLLVSSFLLLYILEVRIGYWRPN